MKLELLLESGSKTMTLGPNGPFRLAAVSGLEAGEYELYTSANAMLDGASVTGQRVLPRPIEITGTLPAGREQDRAFLLSFFHPKHPGALTVRRGERARKIGYRVEALTVSQPTLFHPLRFTAALLCPAPYFLSLSDYGKNAAALTKQFAFPLVIQRGRGKIMAYRNLPRNLRILNDGDIETGLEVRFTAARGPVLNPSLSHTETGEFLRVETRLERGDTLTVSTNSGAKRVLLGGESAFHRIDRGSTFFQLAAGVNTLVYDADENYSNLDVWIFFTPKYLGV